jgi:hypothetical protein
MLAVVPMVASRLLRGGIFKTGHGGAWLPLVHRPYTIRAWSTAQRSSIT